jgi:hypothetical protein
MSKKFEHKKPVHQGSAEELEWRKKKKVYILRKSNQMQ